MSDFIGIDITGEKELADKLTKLTNLDAYGAGVESANKYIVEILQTYPPYRYISRKRAYGRTFVSDKQRRYVMAAIREGRIEIPYHRTQTIRKGWRTVGSGYTQIVANEAPGVKFVMSKPDQSRHEKMVGWETMEDRIQKRMPNIMKRFEEGVRKFLQRIKLI